MPSSILIVEDEPIIAEDLAMILKKEGYHIVGIANDGTTALDLLHNNEVDLALLDIALDTALSGFDIARTINEKYQIPFIFITSFSDKYTLDRAKEVMPHGYIVKPFKKRDILANVEIAIYKSSMSKTSHFLSIEEVNEFVNSNISNKEYEILMDIAKGCSNQDLCDKHYISINTVKTHLKRIYSKLDVKNRSQAVAKLLREN